MTNSRLKEVAHNAACIQNDVYQWDFFERQMKPVEKGYRFSPATKVTLGFVLLVITFLIIVRLAIG